MRKVRMMGAEKAQILPRPMGPWAHAAAGPWVPGPGAHAAAAWAQGPGQDLPGKISQPRCPRPILVDMYKLGTSPADYPNSWWEKAT